MVHFTAAELARWINHILWPLMRVGGFLMLAPIFGSTAFPRYARMGLAVLLALVAAPFVHIVHPIALASWRALGVCCVQLMIGMAMGFIMKAVVSCFELGGTLIGMQSGMGFANMTNPEFAPSVQPVIGNFLSIASVLALLVTNAHLVMLSTLLGSFKTLSVTAGMPPLGHFGALTRWFGIIFRDGVLLALPVVGLLMGTNIALGVISKVAPQLNIFAVGFAVLVSLAFVGLVWVMPDIPAVTTHVFHDSIHALTQTLLTGAGGRGHGG